MASNRPNTVEQETMVTVNLQMQLKYGYFTTPYLADLMTSQRKRGGEIAV